MKFSEQWAIAASKGNKILGLIKEKYNIYLLLVKRANYTFV